MKVLQSVLLDVLLLLVVSFAALGSAPADIVGVEFSTGLVYGIDPITGAVTPTSDQFVKWGASGAPQPGTIFGTSVINLWELNLNTGVSTPVGSFEEPRVGPVGITELAFDRQSGVLYGTDYSSLFSIDFGSCHPYCPTTLEGGLGVPEMWAMGWVPGRGLYGVDDSTDFLFRIDEATGSATPVGPTGVDGITDIAFDSATGELIASAGGPEPFASGPGKIYAIDLQTGGATLLNDNAPNMLGIADTVPEPGSWLLLATSLAALGGLWWLKKSPVLLGQ